MGGGERFLFYAGGLVVALFPVPLLALQEQWLLLVVYVVVLVAAFSALRTGYCTRCMNFACPLNAVGGDVRRRFWEKNPRVAAAWGAGAGADGRPGARAGGCADGAVEQRPGSD
jgi:hypothetical protein